MSATTLPLSGLAGTRIAITIYVITNHVAGPEIYPPSKRFSATPRVVKRLHVRCMSSSVQHISLVNPDVERIEILCVRRRDLVNRIDKLCSCRSDWIRPDMTGSGTFITGLVCILTATSLLLDAQP